MARHDKDELKKSLTVDDIKKLLYELGVQDITDETDSKGHLITNTICHNDSHGKHKLYYYTESQSFHCYTDCSCSFDIYGLVNKVYKLKGIELAFGSIVDWVARKSGKSFGFAAEIDVKKNDSVDWDWIEKVSKKKKVELPEPQTYNDRILDVFSNHGNHYLFTKDHITPEVMDYFNIKFYNKDERIIIPHRFYKNGKIIALRGRATRQSDIDNGAKYMPVTIQGKTYSAPTYVNLFGLHENLEAIKRQKKIIIFESEKSVLQCSSFFGVENNFSVALSGKNISQNQIDIILNYCGVDEVQLALDKEYEDVMSEKAINYSEKVLEIGRRFSPFVQTFVLWDTEGLIGYKDSPSDHGRDVLISLMKSKQEILNKE